MRRQIQPSHPSSLKALAAKAPRASFFGRSVRKLLDSVAAGAARAVPSGYSTDSRLRDMPRYPSPYISSYSFGPGRISTAVKYLIAANVAAFLLQFFFAPVTDYLGLHPVFVVRNLWLWQLATYMFLHGGVFHIVFNMLALWMFGTELEYRWGTRFFVKSYAVTGIGAGVLTVLFSLLPFGAGATAVFRERHRRVGRDLRPAARLRALFSRAPDLHVSRVPDSGASVRRDHRRDFGALVARRLRRRRGHYACRRARRRLRVPQERADASGWRKSSTAT